MFHYNLTKIENEIRNLNSAESINEEILKAFEPNQFYSSKDVKSILNRLYSNLGITKKAKCTELESALSIKAVTKRFGNSVVRGYEL